MLVPVLSPSGSWFCEGTYILWRCHTDPTEKVTVLVEFENDLATVHCPVASVVHELLAPPTDQ